MTDKAERQRKRGSGSGRGGGGWCGSGRVGIDAEDEGVKVEEGAVDERGNTLSLETRPSAWSSHQAKQQEAVGRYGQTHAWYARRALCMYTSYRVSSGEVGGDRSVRCGGTSNGE